MMYFKYFSIKEIQNFIKENNLAIQKKFGQNFLINSGAVDTIINNVDIKNDDLVLEIGCGLGCITHKLIEKKCYVIGFEIDRAYIDNLHKQFDRYENFKLVEGDFLKVINGNLAVLDKKRYKNIYILGNLPYYITSPILEKIFLTPVYFDGIFFMVQKEVAQRIVSKEGSKQYGSLSIFCQYFSNPKIIARLSPKSFYPMPKVESAVVFFEKKSTIEEVVDREFFFKIVRSLFINRRKQIKNNLLMSPLFNGFDEKKILQALRESEIDPSIRGEMLPIKKIIELSNRLFLLK